MRVAASSCLALLGLLLAACGAGTPPPGQLTGLESMRLAEACRFDEAFAAVDRELAATNPGTLQHSAALQEKAVLHRDRHEDAAAEALEADIARLDGVAADVVRSDTLRDVAALRQRRAASFGQPGC